MYPISKYLRTKGFSLLELMIVIIITAVMAGLAIPRFAKTVEKARAQEALIHLGTLRKSMNRCYLSGSSFTGCNGFSFLDTEDPGAQQNTLFSYAIAASGVTFTITSTRNTTVRGDGSSAITIDQDGVKGGTGVFSSIR